MSPNKAGSDLSPVYTVSSFSKGLTTADSYAFLELESAHLVFSHILRPSEGNRKNRIKMGRQIDQIESVLQIQRETIILHLKHLGPTYHTNSANVQDIKPTQ